MLRLLKILLCLLVLLLPWQFVISYWQVPDYLLPSPKAVGIALYTYAPLLYVHALITLKEIIAGLLLGILFGLFAGLTLHLSRFLKYLFLPLLMISQIIPLFALAPLLIIWLGYGLSSKIAITALMVFFPVTSAFYDGLSAVNPEWLQLARTLEGSRIRTLLHLTLPAALPSLLSGIRIALVMAPMSVLMAEWVGASAGLGYLMLNANGRLQIDFMFAALIVMMILSYILYFSVDKILRQWLTWHLL